MTTREKLIKNKLGLLDLAEYLSNVSEACRVMGDSRDTFYRFKKAYEQGGAAALLESNRRRDSWNVNRAYSVKSCGEAGLSS